MTCTCGHGEKEHTDGFGRCHAVRDSCDCLVFSAPDLSAGVER